MKKNIRILISSLIIAAAFIGCDKGDMKIKKLNHGSGIWTIESVHYQYYNLRGSSVISDSTISNPGELILFKNATLDALYDYYLLVANMKDINGNVSAYRGEIFFDNERAHITTTVDGDAIPYQGLWTVEKSNRLKQVWSIFSVRTDGSLYSKTTLSLKKK